MFWTSTRTVDEITVLRPDAPVIDPARFGVESVAVAGGAIDVAILDGSGGFDPALPFAIRLHSPEIALDWLPFVIGDAATAALLSAGDPPVEIKAGRLTDTARRFALGTWMRRWWAPADWLQRIASTPDEWLLDAEIGTLAHDGVALFASYGVADRFLHGKALTLATELRMRANHHPAVVAARSADVPDVLAADPVATALAAAVAAVLDRATADEQTEDVLRAAESDYWDIREGSKVLQTSAEFERDLESMLVPDHRSVLMGGGDYEVAGAGFHEVPIDPFEVHPRSLRAPVLGWYRDGATLHVTIESPVAGSVGLATGELFARVELGAETYAIPLDPNERGFAGRRELVQSLGVKDRDIRVSVYSDRYSAGGRQGRTAEEIDATREILQNFAQARAALVSGSPPAPDAATGPAAPFAVELTHGSA